MTGAAASEEPRAASTRSLLEAGMRRLERAGIGPARREAEWLLSRLMGCAPVELYLDERAAASAIAGPFLAQIDSRIRGIPLQYLLGQADFFGQPFSVSPEVFIPRPETESVVEAALGALEELWRERGRPLVILDAGSGSGCIAITLARTLPACVVVGVELSWKALQTARRNAMNHGVSARVRWLQGRWCEALRGQAVDAVISNPPYIPSGTVDHLPLEVRQEPRMSLDGGADGLRDLSELIEDIPRVLAPGGVVALECAEEQVPQLIRLTAATPWGRNAQPLHDLAGRPRGILVRHAGRAESAAVAEGAAS